MNPLSHPSSRSSSREEGTVSLVALIVVALLAALSLAQFTVAQKNLVSASYFGNRMELRSYAESGLAMGYHDMLYNASGNRGNVGTSFWTESGDVGTDGVAGTKDAGEGDGIPSPGEPNVYPVPVGTQGASMIVHVADMGGVQRIAATVFNGENTVTLQKLVQEIRVPIPRVGAAYVDPDVALDLKGNKFIIDGRDRNPDGSLGSGPDMFGLTTAVGANPGDNMITLLAQISSKYYDQIVGKGASPSIGEAVGVDIDELIAMFARSERTTLENTSYTNVEWGNWAANDLRTLYADHDLHLSGQGSGAGVLIVDGNLRISGQFSFDGLVIVRGDISLVGGGSGIHVLGTVMVKESLEAAAADDSELLVSGNSDLLYSSKILDDLEEAGTGVAGYESVYYGEGCGSVTSGESPPAGGGDDD